MTLGNLMRGFIPKDVKDNAVSGFLALTREVSASDFDKLAKGNVSIWKQCLNNDSRELFRAGFRDNKLAAALMPLIDEDMILDMIIEARTDLDALFKLAYAKLWLFNQIQEIRTEVSK